MRSYSACKQIHLIPFISVDAMVDSNSKAEQTYTKGRQDLNLAESITIMFKTCYVVGKATAQLSVDGNFNASQAFQTIINETQAEFKNITETILDDAEDYFAAALQNKTHGDDITQPNVRDVKFDMDISSIPQALLQLQFDGMELYVQLDTVLEVESTYTLNLFTPDTAIGIAIPDLDIGVWFSLDLILDAKAQVDFSSGFHIKLNDGFKIDLAMFSKDVSNVTL
jgi:hypothetical protein